MKYNTFHALAFAVAATFGLVWNGNLAPSSLAEMMSRADALIGRPATPMSYAGVARRTPGGVGYGVGAAAAVGVAAGVAVGAAASTGCVTTYNAYGQPVTACN